MERIDKDREIFSIPFSSPKWSFHSHFALEFDSTWERIVLMAAAFHSKSSSTDGDWMARYYPDAQKVSLDEIFKIIDLCQRTEKVLRQPDDHKSMYAHLMTGLYFG